MVRWVQLPNGGTFAICSFKSKFIKILISLGDAIQSHVLDRRTINLRFFLLLWGCCRKNSKQLKKLTLIPKFLGTNWWDQLLPLRHSRWLTYLSSEWTPVKSIKIKIIIKHQELPIRRHTRSITTYQPKISVLGGFIARKSCIIEQNVATRECWNVNLENASTALLCAALHQW